MGDGESRRLWRAPMLVLPEAGYRRRSGKSHLARLPEHTGQERPTGDQCARPHRRRPMVQLSRTGNRPRSGRSAWRHARAGAARQQPVQAVGADREGPGREWSGGHTEHARYVDGLQTDGRAYTDNQDHTCNNWTSDTTGTAQLGHSDRTGAGNRSWNSAHPSRGCSQENLVSTGGAGLFYCFAIN